jgi:hypothetical protein
MLLKTHTFSGSTLISALLNHNRYLTIINVGDSRCVGADFDGNYVPLSFDHKPSHVSSFPIWKLASFPCITKNPPTTNNVSFVGFSRFVERQWLICAFGRDLMSGKGRKYSCLLGSLGRVKCEIWTVSFWFRICRVLNFFVLKGVRCCFLVENCLNLFFWVKRSLILYFLVMGKKNTTFFAKFLTPDFFINAEEFDLSKNC